MPIEKDKQIVRESLKGIEPREGKYRSSPIEDHFAARDARIMEVKRRHDEAKSVRLQREIEEGYIESEGAKLDRENAEKAELEDASIVYAIEPATSTDPLYLKNKINEVIIFLSTQVDSDLKRQLKDMDKKKDATKMSEKEIDKEAEKIKAKNNGRNTVK